jgi:hypothetical protein
LNTNYRLLKYWCIINRVDGDGEGCVAKIAAFSIADGEAKLRSCTKQFLG